MKSKAASFFAALLCLLLLESRAVAAKRIWTGGGDEISWHDAANWGGIVPGSNDDACIPALPGNPPVRITTAVTVKSINCDLPLVVSGGSLTVTGPLPASTINAALTATNATLTVSGADTSLAISGVAALTIVNLFANPGAKMSFLGATTYGVSGADVVQATGAGSRIDLSQLTTLAGGGTAMNIKALNGGRVDLGGSLNRAILTVDSSASTLNVANVTRLNDYVTVNASSNAVVTFSSAIALSITSLYADSGALITFLQPTTYGVSGADIVQATGAGSRIDLSLLTTLAGGGTAMNIKALNGGRVDLGGSLNRAILTVDSSASTLNVANVTRLNDYVTVNASSNAVVTFSSATALSITSLYANSGAVISFLQPTTYGVSGADIVQATGTGSRIDLSLLTTLAGGGTAMNIKALNGGRVDLGGCLNRAILTVDSSASTLNVANVTRLNDYVTVNASNNAVVTFSSATTTTITNLFANSGALISIAGSIASSALTLSDSGSTFNVERVTSLSNTTLTVANAATWILPYCWRPTIGSGVVFANSGTGQFINRATLVVTGVQLTMNTTAFSNQGVLDVQSGGIIAVNGSFQVDNPGLLQGVAGANLRVTGNLLGNTQNRYPFTPRETVTFQGTGTPATPQQMEVMSEDRGATSAGFQNNFVYTSLALGNNTRVQLADLSDNFAGAGAEAIYVIALSVPAGCTLDLNGKNVYTRMPVLAGTIVNGTVTQVLDSGPPGINVPRGFENNLGGWTVEGGVWAVGVPTSGPPVLEGSRAHEGARVAATVLAGDYPAGTNSRLITSSFVVPAANQNPRLRFWNWFLLGGSDYGVVEIRVGAGAWTPLSAHCTGGSVDWQRPSLDLVSYAGQTVQVAFHLVDVAQVGDYQNPGWYLDEVEVATGVIEIPQVNVALGFENGMGDWWADNSVWQAGQPTGGPGAAHGGTNCVGTALAGPCPSGTQSRLVGPVFTVPGGSNYDHTTLCFSQWHDFGTGDAGFLQVSVFDGAQWGPWINLGVVAPQGSSGGWKDVPIDLTPYRGKTISLGFLYSANDDASLGAGWFIDDIKLQTLPDTDGDGLVDLLEQAFGPGGEPRVVKENGYLTVTITKQAGFPYSVETASSLQPASWSASTTTVLLDNTTTLKVRDNVLIGTVPMRFMRVRVPGTP